MLDPWIYYSLDSPVTIYFFYPAFCTLSSGFCFKCLIMFYMTIADIFIEENRRTVAGWTIMFTCIGVFVLTYGTSDLSLPRWVYLESLCQAGLIVIVL